MTSPLDSSSAFRRAPVLITAAIAAVNLLVFGWQLMQGHSLMEPTPEQLLAVGGNMAALSLTGESYRLGSALFLHSGALHLLANMYMLALVGPLAARRFGSIGMLAVYGVGGLLSSLASAWYQSVTLVKKTAVFTPFGMVDGSQINLVVSVGASGALMALCGALVASAAFGQQASSPETNTGSAKELLKVVAINIVLGFVIAGVDQAAHVGGFAAGALLGAILSTTVFRQTLAGRSAGAVATVLVASGIAWAVLATGDWAELRKTRAQWDAEQKEVRASEDAKKAEDAERRAVKADQDSVPEPVPESVAMGRLIKTGDSATAMAISDDSTVAYVLDDEHNRLHFVDLAAGQVVRTIQGYNRKAPRCNSPYDCPDVTDEGIALLPDRKLALVASLQRSALSAVDLVDGKIVNTLPLGGRPRAIRVSADGRLAYVHSESTNVLTLIDLEKWSVVKATSINEKGDREEAGVGARMWLNETAGLVLIKILGYQAVVFDAKTLERVTDQTFHAFTRVVPDPQKKESALMLADHSLRQIDERTLRFVGERPFCRGIGASKLAARRDSRGSHWVAVSNQGDGAIRIAKLDTGVSFGTFPVPSHPVQLAYSHDASRLFSLGKDGTLSIIDPTKRMETQIEIDLFCAS